jgi:hypothetical protein
MMNTTLHNNRAKAHETAGSGYGGGAIGTDRSLLSLTRTMITNNEANGATELTSELLEANYVDALYIASPLRIFIRDSTFEPLVWGEQTVAKAGCEFFGARIIDCMLDDGGQAVAINPQILPGPVIQGSCQQYPCAQGSSCKYANFSTSCVPCSENTYSSNGISCEFCLPGTAPSKDQMRCEPCGGPSDPLAFSSSGRACLQCRGANVVSTDRSSCDPCGPGLGPANAQRTHCAPCQGDTMSKSGICEACPSTKVGDGDGISCSDCPPNAEPSGIPLACRCKTGYYNSSFGVVQCKPSPMPAPQNGLVCQPCGACLDCETSLNTFTRALVKPGYKLGVAATRTYRGVERGNLHVNKIFHKCSHGASTLLPHTS